MLAPQFVDSLAVTLICCVSLVHCQWAMLMVPGRRCGMRVTRKLQRAWSQPHTCAILALMRLVFLSPSPAILYRKNGDKLSSAEE